MNYPKFEKIFRSFCKKNFTYDEECIFNDSQDGIKPTSENIDRLILIPAGFSADTRSKYLGDGLSILTKDVLSQFRTGKVMRDYIVSVYSDDNAIKTTSEYFKKYVPRVINDLDRKNILVSLFKGLEVYETVSLKILETMSKGDAFFDTLAAMFIFSITDRYEVLGDLIRNTKVNEGLIEGIIKRLDPTEKPDSFICESIDFLFDSYWENIRYMFSPLKNYSDLVDLIKETEKMPISPQELFELIAHLLPFILYFDDIRQREIYCLANIAYYDKIHCLCNEQKYYEVLDIIADLRIRQAAMAHVSISIKEKSATCGLPTITDARRMLMCSLLIEFKCAVFSQSKEEDRFFALVCERLDCIFNVFDIFSYIQGIPGRNLVTEDEHWNFTMDGIMKHFDHGWKGYDANLSIKDNYKNYVKYMNEIWGKERGDKK